MSESKHSARSKILVVDDEEFVRESLVEILGSEGFEVRSASGMQSALESAKEAPVDLVLTDLSMPDGSGQELLEELRKRGEQMPVVVLTGVGSVPEAVRAMRAGAADFLQKPVDADAIVWVLRRALEHRELTDEVKRLRRTVSEFSKPQPLVGDSAWLKGFQSSLPRLADSDATVLITGESGTGKELVALAIHQASARAGKACVRVNCAAIPESLFESEFFGHVKGAFAGAASNREGRFAEADGGTLVLDEVGSLALAMQAKLLRVLESGEYQVVGESRARHADVRVLAITNEDLEERVQAGEFRKDLFYRLNIFPVHVPPLRERSEDIAPIAQDFLQRMDPKAQALDESALEVLRSYAWPGNARELCNVLERARICSDATLNAPLLRSVLESGPTQQVSTGDEDLYLRVRMDRLERELIVTALERSEGVKRAASEMLGVDPRNLGYYLRKHGLSSDGGGAKE